MTTFTNGKRQMTSGYEPTTLITFCHIWAVRSHSAKERGKRQMTSGYEPTTFTTSGYEPTTFTTYIFMIRDIYIHVKQDNHKIRTYEYLIYIKYSYVHQIHNWCILPCIWFKIKTYEYLIYIWISRETGKSQNQRHMNIWYTSIGGETVGNVGGMHTANDQ